MIFIYLLNGKKYNGEIYFKNDQDVKHGFICAIDPYFINLLTVIKVPYDEKVRRESHIIKRLLPNIFET